MNAIQRALIVRELLSYERDLQWHKMKVATEPAAAKDVGTISDHRVQVALLERQIAELKEGL
jgi:hypothetical protein